MRWLAWVAGSGSSPSNRGFPYPITASSCRSVEVLIPRDVGSTHHPKVLRRVSTTRTPAVPVVQRGSPSRQRPIYTRRRLSPGAVCASTGGVAERGTGRGEGRWQKSEVVRKVGACDRGRPKCLMGKGLSFFAAANFVVVGSRPSNLSHAPVAQLDRVPGYEPGGREFESLRARQLK